MSVAKPIQSGPHVFNFAKVFQWLTKHNAVDIVANPEQLAKSTLRLLQQPAERRQLAERGYALYQQHGGATLRVTQRLKQLLPKLGEARLVKRDQQLDIWYDPMLVQAGGFSKPSQAFFEPHSWLQFDAVIGQSTGRNTVWFVQAQQQKWVLRHYYRGGLIGKLNKDRFLKVPASQSRAMTEFSLLQYMHQRGLPVPRPVAALFAPKNMSYRADILLELVDGSQDLAKLLRQQALTSTQWQQVGQMIRKFHDAQIYHSDLNCHNILLDPQGQFWLIDFDKCAIRQGDSWKEQTLARLARSLQKEAGLAAADGQSWYFHTTDWQLLRQGYAQ